MKRESIFSAGMIFCLIAAASLALADPPPWAPAHGRRGKSKAASSTETTTYQYQYKYFPGAQVYFDTARNLYFYQAGGQWKQAARLPQALQGMLGNGVELEMSTATPQQYHRQIVTTYSTSGSGAGAAQQAVTSGGAGAMQQQGMQTHTVREETVTTTRTVTESVSGARAPQPSASAAQTVQYRYFPGSSVYFDPGRGMYFYSLDNQWHSAKTLPSGFALNRQEFVTVDIESATPYVRHQEIVQRYGQGVSAVQVQEKIKVDVQSSGSSSKVKSKIHYKEKGGKGKHKTKIKVKHKEKHKGKHK